MPHLIDQSLNIKGFCQIVDETSFARTAPIG
jgi:hypothetical protein